MLLSCLAKKWVGGGAIVTQIHDFDYAFLTETSYEMDEVDDLFF